MNAVKEYYNKYACHYNSSRKTKHFLKLNRIQLEFLIDNVGLESEVLDVGCGNGDFLKHFSNSCGIDFSEEMVAITKNHNLNACIGDATNLAFDDNSFDYAFSFKVFAHVPNCERMLSEMVRVSRKGIVFDFYKELSPKTIKDSLTKTTYLRHDSFNSIKFLLKDLNAEIKTTKEHKGYFMVYAIKQQRKEAKNEF